MKFLLEFVTCSGSCSSEVRRTAAEETRLLVVQDPLCRAGRKQGRARVGSSGVHEWQPSLSSISEDLLMSERIQNVERPAAGPGWRRSLKTKVSSISQRDRSRSFDHDDGRRPKIPAMIMPIFAPMPFMF